MKKFKKLYDGMIGTTKKEKAGTQTLEGEPSTANTSVNRTRASTAERVDRTWIRTVERYYNDREGHFKKWANLNDNQKDKIDGLVEKLKEDRSMETARELWKSINTIWLEKTETIDSTTKSIFMERTAKAGSIEDVRDIARESLAHHINYYRPHILKAFVGGENLEQMLEVEEEFKRRIAAADDKERKNLEKALDKSIKDRLKFIESKDVAEDVKVARYKGYGLINFNNHYEKMMSRHTIGDYSGNDETWSYMHALAYAAWKERMLHEEEGIRSPPPPEPPVGRGKEVLSPPPPEPPTATIESATAAVQQQATAEAEGAKEKEARKATVEGIKDAFIEPPAERQGTPEGFQDLYIRLYHVLGKKGHSSEATFMKLLLNNSDPEARGKMAALLKEEENIKHVAKDDPEPEVRYIAISNPHLKDVDFLRLRAAKDETNRVRERAEERARALGETGPGATKTGTTSAEFNIDNFMDSFSKNPDRGKRRIINMLGNHYREKNSADLLKLIAERETKTEIRIRAIDEITDMEFLKKLAETDKDPKIQQRAAQSVNRIFCYELYDKIGEEQFMGRLLKEADLDLKGAMVLTLHDQTNIKKIAVEDKDPGIRLLAVHNWRLDDIEFVRKRTTEDPDQAVRKEAEKRLHALEMENLAKKKKSIDDVPIG